MSFFDTFLLTTVAVIFPLLIYLVYSAYKSNINSDLEFDNAVFEILLITTLFFIMKITHNNYNNYTVLLINMPLLFSYIKGRKGFALFLSIVLSFYFSKILGYNTILIVVEYVSYYILLTILIKKNTSVKQVIKYFTIIKTFFFSMCIYYTNSNFINIFNKILVAVIVFYLCSITYYFILSKIEEIVNLNNSLKQLEKEKTLRNSLFKLTHEIKNPIAVCKGYLDMFDINNKKNAEKYINIIKNEIERTLIIMDDFLDYSKIKLNKNIMDIVLLLEETTDSMSPLFKKNNVEIDMDLEDDEVYIDGDYNRLKQVLVNIIKNAIEATSDEDKAKVCLTTKIQNKNIKISISDNGVGIDKEEINNIGKAFYTTKVKGTGLGVLLSKEIIDLHEGSIDYYSIKGRGTTVTIVLPIL